jgi:hypothetical protein
MTDLFRTVNAKSKQSNNNMSLNQKHAAIMKAYSDGSNLIGQEFKFANTEKDVAESSYKEFQAKALTVANSGGLIPTAVNPLLNIIETAGVFLKSGVQFRNGVAGNQVFSTMLDLGDYAPQYLNTNNSNDISSGITSVSISADRYTAYVPLANQLLAKAQNPGELIGATEAQLENKKLLLMDRLITNKILTNPNVIAVDPASVTSTQGKIFEVLNRETAKISSVNAGVPNIYTSTSGFSQMLNERDSQGRPLETANTGFNGKLFEVKDWYQAQLEGRPVGTFNGIPVYILNNKVIGSTYSTNATGKVAFTTGGGALDFPIFTAGTKTLFIIAVPSLIGALAGNSEFDTIKVINNDLQSFQNDTYTIAGATTMGADVILPKAITYYAV